MVERRHMVRAGDPRVAAYWHADDTGAAATVDGYTGFASADLVHPG